MEGQFLRLIDATLDDHQGLEIRIGTADDLPYIGVFTTDGQLLDHEPINGTLDDVAHVIGCSLGWW